MHVFSFKALIAAVATSALASVAAAAPQVNTSVLCSDSVATTGNSSYLSCAGPFDGNNLGAKGLGSSLLYGGNSYALADEELDFSNGTLTFQSAVAGLFVVALKGGPDYSLYLFDGGAAGVASLKYDTLGLYKGNGSAGPGLSHATLYGGTAPIPEPETYALMLAGLGVMAIVARRRRTR